MSAGQRLLKFYFTSESVSEGHPGPSFFYIASLEILTLRINL
jgi:hypothetical protein